MPRHSRRTALTSATTHLLFVVIVAELIAGVGVGGFIGWALDRQLGTRPWLLVLFVTLGFAAGLTNVIRAAQKAQNEAAASQLATPAAADDDEDDR